MPRKLLLSLSLVAVAVAAFVATSHALAPKPAIRADLPARGLPVVAVSDSVRASIASLIGVDAAQQFGISSDSYTQIRQLATTSAGAIYVVPGTNGLCVALLPAVSCGRPGHNADASVAVFVPDPSGNFLVGGGVTAASAGHVSLHARNGATADATAVDGGFTLSASAGIKPGQRFEVVVQ